MSDSVWMVRSDGGDLFETFEKKKIIAIGWREMGDLSALKTREAIRDQYERAFSESPGARSANAIGMLHRFRNVIDVGSKVVSYSPSKRTYLVGTVSSDYRFAPNEASAECPHVRTVAWFGQVGRDSLSPATRNTLGSTLTVFDLGEEAGGEMLAAASGQPALREFSEASAQKSEVDAIKEDEAARSLELIKDAIVALSDRELEELTAAVLRAMGYRAHVTPIGPDRGVDVIASPDGLGLEEPRIKAEVKHRFRTQIGASDVRGFLGGLRQGDRGLYVSSGGFSKEARYEAERSNVPCTLVDLPMLAQLVVTHYEQFDVDGRIVLPLVRVYLPAE